VICSKSIHKNAMYDQRIMMFYSGIIQLLPHISRLHRVGTIHQLIRNFCLARISRPNTLVNLIYVKGGIYTAGAGMLIIKFSLGIKSRILKINMSLVHNFEKQPISPRASQTSLTKTAPAHPVACEIGISQKMS
jgi:hypothetical protein